MPGINSQRQLRDAFHKDADIGRIWRHYAYVYEGTVTALTREATRVLEWNGPLSERDKVVVQYTVKRWMRRAEKANLLSRKEQES